MFYRVCTVVDALSVLFEVLYDAMTIPLEIAWDFALRQERVRLRSVDRASSAEFDRSETLWSTGARAQNPTGRTLGAIS